MLYLTNAPIIPISGEDLIVRAKEVSVNEAKELINREEWVSAIGHKSTAELLSIALEKEIPMNRVEIKIRKGDKILAFSLNRRLEEGKVIKDMKELEEIGYRLMLFEAVIEGNGFERIMKLAKDLADCIQNETPICDEKTYDWLSLEMHKII